MEYSIAEMIDRLSIINLKIWHSTEIIINENSSLEEAGAAAKRAEAANGERRRVIKDIDDFFKQNPTDTGKM